jgi:hypothetical protein
LILIALTELRHPAAPAAYARLMHLLDLAGAWNEYYDGTDRAVRGSIRANLLGQRHQCRGGAGLSVEGGA